jgi:general secretion pathway protein G
MVKAIGRRLGSGFTLVELLVVLTIVALLLSIALPRYFSSVERAKETALAENLRVMRIALDRFRADRGRWPKTLEELVAQRYLPAIPFDPVADRRDAWIVVAPTNSDEDGVADVFSGASGANSDGQAYRSL